MKIVFIHLALLTSFIAFGQAQKNQKVVEINTESSYVEIHGTTNINSFNCGYNTKLPEDKFKVTIHNAGDEIRIQHEALFLKVINFKCPNPQMTDDFHDLLEYEDYPFIIFKLNKIIDNSTAHITIEMAGKKQSYLIRLDNSVQNTSLISTAAMELCITDFGLEAPEKFFGMVKVNENIEVEFRIELNIYDN